MKLLRLSTLFASVLSIVVLINCSSDKESDLTSDCSNTDLSIQVVEVVDENCETEGSISVSASGGEGTLLFVLGTGTPGSSTTFAGLSAGNYTITVIDGLDCMASVDVQVMAEDGSIMVDLAVDSQAGCETSDGAITATATGGDGNYTYSIDGGSFDSSNSFSGLAAGEHVVVAKDGSGCESSASTTLETGISLSTDVMPIISANCAISGCHGDSQSPNLNTASQIMDAADRIKSRTQAETMPPASRPDLSDEEIALIACWVDDGAQNN